MVTSLYHPRRCVPGTHNQVLEVVVPSAVSSSSRTVSKDYTLSSAGPPATLRHFFWMQQAWKKGGSVGRLGPGWRVGQGRGLGAQQGG